jgi:FMN phosphatase YigB (HAD superfamily)
MSIVAVDLDMTLYNFDAEVREAFFELAIKNDDKTILRGAYSTNMEWRNLTDVLGPKMAYEAIELVHERTLEQEAFKGSADAVSKLWWAGHEIRYVTGRLEKHKPNTKSWLAEQGFPVGEVICAHDKKEHIEDCQYLIDDRPKTLVDFVTDFDWRTNSPNLERKAFGLWTSYNRNLTDVKNIYLAPTWRGIDFYLERKGLYE